MITTGTKTFVKFKASDRGRERESAGSGLPLMRMAYGMGYPCSYYSDDRQHGVEWWGIAGPSNTLGCPWISLEIRPCNATLCTGVNSYQEWILENSYLILPKTLCPVNSNSRLAYKPRGSWPPVGELQTKILSHL
jgi:hypothetical protein